MSIKLLDIDKVCEDLEEVSSPRIFDKKGFCKTGLFSEQIFGPIRTCTCACGIYWGRDRIDQKCKDCGVKIVHSNYRRKTYAKICLSFPIINPLMYYLILKVGKAKIKEIIQDLLYKETVYGYYYSKEEKAYIKLDYSPTFEIPELPKDIKIYTGSKGVFELIKTNCEKYMDKSTDWKYIYNNLDKFYMNNILVCPPDFRPISKKRDAQMMDELNKFYMTILNFNSVVKDKNLLFIGDERIFKINFRNLQKYVFDLYEYIFSKLSKKTGLIRGFILGKRIDFSGRFVICPDPSLHIDECSIPYFAALELYRLEIANELIETRQFKRYEPALKYIDDCIKKQNFNLYDVTEKIIKGRYIILNRQPTLHRMGMLAFKFTINDSFVIKIPPLICEPYNADFDGDQMAIYRPLYKNCEKECKDKLSVTANLLSPATGDLITSLNQDIILGIYLLTQEGQTEKVKYKGIDTWKGRVIFNKCFPKNYPFINKIIDKKTIKIILNDLAKTYKPDEMVTILYKLKELGFKHTTVDGRSMSLKNMNFLDAKSIIKKILDSKKTVVEKWKEIHSPKITKQLEDGFPYSSFIQSGSRGSWDQVRQVILCRGFVSNSKGEIVKKPIKSNLINGLTKEEFFTSCYGSRKGLLDIALNTGVSGYLTRKLIFCSVNLVLDQNMTADCGTKDVFILKISKKNEDGLNSLKLMKCLIGRYIIDNGKKILINYDNYHTFIGKTINLRSPLFCENKEICPTCYGETSKIMHSPYIGIIAAQVFGEISTQLTLRTFHTSGVAKLSDEVEGGDKHQDIISDLNKVKKLFHCTDTINYDKLISKLYKIYGSYKDVLLVHYECIVSQMMRIGRNRWRLSEDRDITKCQMTSIDSVPSKESFLLSLAYSKPKYYIIKELLETNLIGKRDLGILEKIMTNNKL